MSINNEWNTNDIEKYKSVKQIQDQLKKENAEYLSNNPEVRAIVRTLLHEAINADVIKPSELAATIFDYNLNPVLNCKIDEERLYVIKQLKNGNWASHDLDNLVENTSTHSLLSDASLCTDVDAILRFCLVKPNPNAQ